MQIRHKYLPFAVGLTAVAAVGAIVWVVLSAKGRTLTLRSPRSALSFVQPKGWVREEMPDGAADLQRIDTILFRIGEEAPTPAVAFRFWDNLDSRTPEHWATQRALEAELGREPSRVTIGGNTFVMLSPADGPGLSEAVLYRTIGNRILEIDIQSDFAIHEHPYFDPAIRKFLESVRVAE